jgi:hypothetical protein
MPVNRKWPLAELRAAWVSGLRGVVDLIPFNVIREAMRSRASADRIRVRIRASPP